MEKKINYTEMDRAIVAALEGNEEGMTLAELSQKIGKDVKAGHITSAKNKGLVSKVGEASVEKATKRKVSSYSFVNAENHNKDGKDFSEAEKAVLDFAAGTNEEVFTLADVNAVSAVKVASGTMTSLVNKGNLAKGEPVEKIGVGKSKVGLYAVTAEANDLLNA